MARKQEIEIIIQHLLFQIKNASSKNTDEFILTVIENGKLIEAYKDELNKLNNQ
jgi:hypothetical protein